MNGSDGTGALPQLPELWACERRALSLGTRPLEAVEGVETRTGEKRLIPTLNCGLLLPMHGSPAALGGGLSCTAVSGCPASDRVNWYGGLYQLEHMGKNKQQGTPKDNTMDHYALLAHASQCAMRHTSGWVDQSTDHGELSRAELLQAIQGSPMALENKIETVAIKVNLLRTDLRKISNKVCLAERSIEELQMKLATLKKQVPAAESRAGALEARVEDSEELTRRNNVRLLGFPERAEGAYPSSL
ncbi:hypothetical protein NDU88_005152 [Pleurodeles waltl]|uniref:Uncharacterized protein n=1 Tax=Pleurodeles waltl TaxID=8319 RepID=A0AAV7LT13_PLEWA|nr:hypothetical protein NDU88_005152 [Pleurodeles waltl]